MDKKPKPKTAQSFLPQDHTLEAAKSAVQDCQGCDLYQHATQAVFGEGSERAKIVFVGEKPGDKEDLQGHPFVGPAGRILDRALGDLAIRRTDVYITNAVKHFKWLPRGKKRIHQKPNTTEVNACKPWLSLEVEVLHPRVLVCMGTTAAYAVFGKSVRIKDYRAQFHVTSYCEKTLVTVHPSAIVRIVETEERERAYQRFVEDLRPIKELSGPNIL